MATGRKTGGRKKGTPNKTTTQAKEAIALAAEKLGGTERLVAWAQEDSKNEATFWGTIYPKLLPLTVDGRVDSEQTVTHKHDPAAVRAAVEEIRRISGSLTGDSI